jgi:hypothetical protein
VNQTCFVIEGHCFMLSGFFALVLVLISELWLNFGSVIVGEAHLWSMDFWFAQAFYASGHLFLSMLFTAEFVQRAGITPANALGFQIGTALLLLFGTRFIGWTLPLVAPVALSPARVLGIVLIVAGAIIARRG